MFSIVVRKHGQVPEDHGLHSSVRIRNGVDALVEAEVPGDWLVRVIGGVQQLVDSLQLLHGGDRVGEV